MGSPCSDDSDPDPEDKNRLNAPSPALPEAIRTLPEEARVKLLQRSALRSIGLGLVLIVVLTDPMVDALEVFAHRIQIPSFFVAFILAPLASSSLEVIAACRYAAKKTIKVQYIARIVR